MDTQSFEAIGYLFAGFVLLTIGAEVLVRASLTLAIRSGISPLVVGLTVVAFSTSAPELVASLFAAWLGSHDLAVGNVIGSNISNLSLVLGLAAVITPLAIHRRVVAVDTPIALGVSVLLIAFVFDGEISRIEAGVLFVGILVYTMWRVTQTNPDVDPVIAEETKHGVLGMSNWLASLLVLVSAASLAAGAYFFVVGGQSIARLLGVPEVVIGLTVLAVGTSLPEIATVIVAARKSIPDLVVGNVIGSNIFNILSVLGLTGLVVPLRAQGITVVDLTVFIGSAALLLIVMMTRMAIERAVGLALIVGYVAYVVYLY